MNYATVPGFPAYRVGLDGSIWSAWKPQGRGRGRAVSDRWKKLNPSPDKDGYLKVILCDGKGGRKFARLHQLVLLAFVGPCPAGMEAAHNGNDRADCRLSNLRYDTHLNNLRDKFRHGTAQIGEGAGNVLLDERKVIDIRKKWANRESTQTEMAQEYGVAQCTISAIVTRRIWKHVP